MLTWNETWMLPFRLTSGRHQQCSWMNASSHRSDRNRPFRQIFCSCRFANFRRRSSFSTRCESPLSVFHRQKSRPRRFSPAKPNSSRLSMRPARGHGAARGRPCAVAVAILSNRTPSAHTNMGPEDNNPWQTVTYGRKIYSLLHTVIIQPQDGLSLAKTRPAQAMQSLAAAARLTPAEVR